MAAPSKATVYLKGEKPPVVVEGFAEVYMTTGSQEKPVRIVPEHLPIYHGNAYSFIGSNSSLSVAGSELQAVYFE
ncbi:MAG: hypothetical protein IJ521_00010 [Schwartzia sp.]|nr:hypothetical protein [Schwartzia sp. (in: firmicutes)]